MITPTSHTQKNYEEFQSLPNRSSEEINKGQTVLDEPKPHASQPNRDEKNKSIFIMLIVVNILTLAFAGYLLITCKQTKPKQQRLPEEKNVAKSNQQHPFEKKSQQTFNYPTVGIPEPGKQFNSTRVRLQDLAVFDEEINTLFKPYNDTNCEIVRVGGSRDGGYLICNNFIPQSQAIINLGINRADKFGCTLSSTFSMPNYQYDCTISNIPSCGQKIHSSVFFPICVGQISKPTEKPIILSLQEMIKNQNLSKKHIILKMDTEGAEFEAFKYFPVENLDYVDQILMEVHFMSSATEVWGNLQILRTLASKFININYHMNNYVCFQDESKNQRKLPSMAFEISLINKKLITLYSESRSFSVHPLNAKNHLQGVDCQIEE